MSQRVFRFFFNFALLLTIVFLVRVVAPAQQAGGALMPGQHVIKFSPQLTHQALAARPDTDLIELSNGKRLQLGDVRRMLAAAQKARATAATPAPFMIKPAATGRLVANSADLAGALKAMRDTDTLQLPSGRRVTVGQIRHLQRYIEMTTGRKLDAPMIAPKLTGPSIKLARGVTDEQLKKILPVSFTDDTILESQSGRRVTVGQIKQYLESGANPFNRTMQSKKRPVAGQTQTGRPQ